MNHQTAKIIAESYRTRAGAILNSGGTMLLRAEILYDHAAVWQRVADALTPLVHNHDLDPSCQETRQADGSLRGACMEAPHVPQ